MNWQPLGNFTLTEEWQLSIPIKAELFRVTHLSVPLKQDYVKAVIAQGFKDDHIVSVFTPQRLTSRQEKEIFNFSNFINSEKNILFKRLDKATDIIWKIKLEYKNMLIPSNKPQITSAQSLPDSVIVNAKKMIIPEKLDSSRRNYLISNLGTQTLYCKYLPLGTDPTLSTFVISSSDYDFLLTSGEKWLDSTLSQNAVYGVTANAFSAKVKAVEYNYL